MIRELTEKDVERIIEYLDCAFMSEDTRDYASSDGEMFDQVWCKPNEIAELHNRELRGLIVLLKAELNRWKFGKRANLLPEFRDHLSPSL